MTLLEKIEVAFIKRLGKIVWKLKNPVTLEEQGKIRDLLAKDYYIILTRNNNHLSTYFINFGDFILGRGWSYWGHALLNMEDMTPTDDQQFELIESTAIGVHLESFANVFDVNSVAILKPKSMAAEDWTKVFAQALADVGKPYDNLFNMNGTDSFSCVEFVRNALQADPNYAVNFANFEAMCQKYKRITPQMFYDCPDFEVVYEVRHK